MSAPDVPAAHYRAVAKALAGGRAIPFLGAGVNLCGRDPTLAWHPGQSEYLPSGAELARYLAEAFDYPPSEPNDLLRVSQYVAVMQGSGPLYTELHTLFDADYPPTPLHRFLAQLPAALREKGYPPRHQLIVTTNYDDLMERAFREAGQPFDLVAYVAEGENRGKFVHWPFEGDPRLIAKPDEYREVSTEQRPVIIKIHGEVDRHGAVVRDSFVITEDHYIDYLTRTDLASLVPVNLAAKLKQSHFLFLGYGMRDWNLRVILHRIAGEQTLTYKSWAIQLDPDALEQRIWTRRDVEILNVDLGQYVAQLDEHVRALPPPPPRAEGREHHRD